MITELKFSGKNKYKGLQATLGAYGKTLKILAATAVIQVMGGSKGPSMFSGQLAKSIIETRCPNSDLGLVTLPSRKIGLFYDDNGGPT